MQGTWKGKPIEEYSNRELKEIRKEALRIGILIG